MIDQNFYTPDEAFNKGYLTQLKNNFTDTKKMVSLIKKFMIGIKN